MKRAMNCFGQSVTRALSLFAAILVSTQTRATCAEEGIWLRFSKREAK